MISEDELQALKQQIKERLAALQHADDTHEDRLQMGGELSYYDNHPADSGTDLFEREKDQALHEHEDHERQELLFALERINHGTYGICQETGAPIPLERLQALPEARTVATVTADEHLASDRPVEEDILSSMPSSFSQPDDNRYDGEDAWQEVATYGSSDSPSDIQDPAIQNYVDINEANEERVGAVERHDSFMASRDLDGAGHINVQSKSHEAYEDALDDEAQTGEDFLS
ncbi:yteA family sporulation protein [Bacillaceae bacterium SIJ1]|uniref:TraR/DksA C4-type zinc finger protein n=1 Tax=Litoribacterium kuwaitense TaxID=1398745 RepID=UPI0013ED9F72|nr:TraR/DksA C4-type zinc finger protein [Litoribacterium kuwaitense]NGP44243.1 yteA family sporulation protein [Litoribacterium kuwaitense]